jgi:hypothetical protein
VGAVSPQDARNIPSHTGLLCYTNYHLVCLPKSDLTAKVGRKSETAKISGIFLVFRQKSYITALLPKNIFQILGKSE